LDFAYVLKYLKEFAAIIRSKPLIFCFDVFLKLLNILLLM